MKVLVTGGPVHAYLDDVKIVTNRFKGGLMAKLAGEISTLDMSVDYLRQINGPAPTFGHFVECFSHDGFGDYADFISKNGKNYDAIILGAAVANLIPLKKIEGKFPSHNYKVGEVIPIEFTIAPRIIGTAKKWMKPGAHLFGFKLLSNVNREELIRAAYEVVLESGATAVFANDASNLDTVYAVTKERSVIPMKRDQIATFVKDRLDDKYYNSGGIDKAERPSDYENALAKFYRYADIYSHHFPKIVTSSGFYTFGNIAIRSTEGGFYTTTRGKKDMDGNLVWVSTVDHDKRIVYGRHPSARKASLNAPLLHHIFKDNPRVDAIVHYHAPFEGIKTQRYATPGTLSDTVARDASTSFNVEYHGCYLMLNDKGFVL